MYNETISSYCLHGMFTYSPCTWVQIYSFTLSLFNEVNIVELFTMEYAFIMEVMLQWTRKTIGLF